MARFLPYSGLRQEIGAKHLGSGMARGAMTILRKAFCLVELGGLEPPTPCLQNRPRLSETVAHLGLWPQMHRLGSDLVGSCCGQAWWSVSSLYGQIRGPRRGLGATADSALRSDALDRVHFGGHRDSVSYQPVDVSGEQRDTRRSQGSQITTASGHVAGGLDRRCCAIPSVVCRLVEGVNQPRHCRSPALRYVRRE
jgi:hypothetical protein